MTYDGRAAGAQDLTTILPDLEHTFAARVLDLYRNDDGTFTLMEGCDGYFGVTLTAEQVRRFAQWLLEWIGDA